MFAVLHSRLAFTKEFPMFRIRHLAASALCCVTVQATAATFSDYSLADHASANSFLAASAGDEALESMRVWRIDPREFRAYAVSEDNIGAPQFWSATASAAADHCGCSYTGPEARDSWHARSGWSEHSRGEGWWGGSWHWRWTHDDGDWHHHGHHGTSPIPEPSGIALMGIGLALLGIGLRKRMSSR